MTKPYFEKHKNVSIDPSQVKIIQHSKKQDFYQKQQAIIRKLKIHVNGTQITVNGKPTSLVRFSKTVDQITNNWSKSDLQDYNLDLSLSNVPDGFMQKLDTEFRKTKAFKANPSDHGLLPPPPPEPPTPPAPIKAPEPPEAPESPEKGEVVEIFEENEYSKQIDSLEITLVETGEKFKVAVDPANTAISEEEINAYTSVSYTHLTLPTIYSV